MFPNQTPEPPQQPIVPPVVPPTPPTTSVPTPTSMPTPNTVPMQTPTSFESNPAPINAVDTPVAKQPASKKMILIITGIVVLLALAAAAIFFILPALGTKTVNSNGSNGSADNSAQASKLDLVTKSGSGYSLLVPSAYKSTMSSNSTVYSLDGNNTNTNANVSVLTYKDKSLNSSLFDTYSHPIADSIVSKGYTFEKLTHKGFEAVQGQATVIKDGKNLYVSHTLVVKTAGALYLVVINIPTGDTSGLEDGIDTIFDSVIVE